MTRILLEFFFEESATHDVPAGEAETHSRPQAAEAIENTPPEVDGRGLAEIPCWTTHLRDDKTFPTYLSQHLIVQHTIFRVSAHVDLV